MKQEEGLKTCIELEACFAMLSNNGNIINRHAKFEDLKILKIDGIEIDNICFNVKSEGENLIIVMKSINENKVLSSDITPNYPNKNNAPLFQIKAKKPDAKFTVSVLNKFILKTHKLFSKNGKGVNAILVKSIMDSKKQ